MQTAVEEAISICYMLRCLGVPVTEPTDLFGDNFGVIQSAEIPDGELKKKHIASEWLMPTGAGPTKTLRI